MFANLVISWGPHIVGNHVFFYWNIGLSCQISQQSIVPLDVTRPGSCESFSKLGTASHKEDRPWHNSILEQLMMINDEPSLSMHWFLRAICQPECWMGHSRPYDLLFVFVCLKWGAKLISLGRISKVYWNIVSQKLGWVIGFEDVLPGACSPFFFD